MIPKPVRDKLGVGPGDSVEFEIRDSEVLIRPLSRSRRFPLPFPYVERLASKRRPALVVSRPRLARDHGLVWVLMITSAATAGWPDDIPIGDLRRAGLPNPSVVRPTKIATVETTHAGRLGEFGRPLPPGFWRPWACCFRVSTIALNEPEGRDFGVQHLHGYDIRATKQTCRNNWRGWRH